MAKQRTGSHGRPVRFQGGDRLMMREDDRPVSKAESDALKPVMTDKDYKKVNKASNAADRADADLKKRRGKERK
jgi:hypothetical protein